MNKILICIGLVVLIVLSGCLDLEEHSKKELLLSKFCTENKYINSDGITSTNFHWDFSVGNRACCRHWYFDDANSLRYGERGVIYLNGNWYFDMTKDRKCKMV